MKSFYRNLLLMYGLLALDSCQPVPSSVSTPGSESISADRFGLQTMTATDYYSADVHYKLIKTSHGGIAVINVTQDSLVLARFKRADQQTKAAQ